MFINLHLPVKALLVFSLCWSASVICQTTPTGPPSPATSLDTQISSMPYIYSGNISSDTWRPSSPSPNQPLISYQPLLPISTPSPNINPAQIDSSQSTPSSAKFSWPARKYAPWVVFVLGATADIITTHQGLKRGCKESNTAIYGRHPSFAKLVAAHALIGSLEWTFFNDHPSVPYLTGGLFAAAAIHNNATRCR